MKYLASILWNFFTWPVFTLVFALMYPLVLTVYLVTLPLPASRASYFVNGAFGVWGRLLVILQPGWTYQMEGREKLPRGGRLVFVVNHQSHLDGMLVYTLFRPFSVVSKLSVLWAPMAGWCLLLTRPILLRRGSKKSVARMRRSLAAKLAQHVPVLLFPEGTRSADGELQPFQRGAFALAVAESCPICPVVLDGSRHGMAKGSLRMLLRAPIRLRALDPVHPEDFAEANGVPLDRPQQILAMRDHVHSLMSAELNRMRAPSQVRSEVGLVAARTHADP